MRCPSSSHEKSSKRDTARVGGNGFLSAHPFVSKARDTTSSSRVPLPPDEILFKQKNAPDRFEEDDIYWTDRRLGPGQPLPDSDLLKAVHAYSSDFYAAALGDFSKRDFKSMDETALLAMGILLEEAATDVLGETGDLTFVEGEDDDGLDASRIWNGTTWTRSVLVKEPARGGKRGKGPASGNGLNSKAGAAAGDSDIADSGKDTAQTEALAEGESASEYSSGHYSSIGHSSESG